MHRILARIVGYGLILLGLAFGWLPVIPGILLILLGIYVIEKDKIDTFALKIRKLIRYEECTPARRVARRTPRKR